MNLRRLTFETTLFTLAFTLALVVRLLNLGAAPLSDSEAAWAMQALQLARPATASAAIQLGPQAAYIMLTGLTMNLLGATNFLARFWPALAGAFLVLLPVCFRRELGRSVALLMAFGLAIDPGLAPVSRQAGGPMLALSFGLLALGLLRLRRPVFAGILGGLALLSGPAILTGALGLGLAWGVVTVANRSRSSAQSQEEDGEDAFVTDDAHAGGDYISDEAVIDAAEDLPDKPAPTRGRTVWLAAGGVILLVGTGLLHYPQGLTAWFDTLPAYLSGWVTPSGVAAMKLVAALIFYEFFALVFAVIAVMRRLFQRNWTDEQPSIPPLFLLLWLVFGLLLGLVYPNRQVSDLVWISVPLWALAAQELAGYLPEGKPNLISSLQAGLVTILAILLWNTLISTVQIVPTSSLTLPMIRLAILGGILALGALTTVLVALGWSWRISRDGLVWGLVIVFSVFMLSDLWGAAQLRFNQPQELWAPTPSTGQADLMVKTLNDLSTWSIGFPQSVSVDSTVDTPSLRWVLRDNPQAHFVSQLPVSQMPDVLITGQAQQAPSLTAAYRGQDFVWWVYPGWTGALPDDFVGWLTFRQAPLTNEKIILWARSDLFPGTAKQQSTNP